MAADAPAPYVAKSSCAILWTIWDNKSLYHIYSDHISCQKLWSFYLKLHAQDQDFCSIITDLSAFFSLVMEKYIFVKFDEMI